MLTKVTEKEIPLLKQYLALAEYKHDTYNLICMFMWLDDYPLYYYHTNTALYLFVWTKEDFYAYAPLCHFSSLKEAFVEVKSIFEQMNKPMKFACLPCNVHAKLEVVYPNVFESSTSRNQANYIYLASKLRNYAGKQMQKKRNNYNFFIKNYQGRVEFKELGLNHCSQCCELIGKWLSSKDNADSPTLVTEANGIRRILRLYDSLEMQIGGVFIDGIMEGFSICSLLTSDCVQCNVEKANGSIRGLYQYLVATMQQTFYPNAMWCNREDDLGLESLRKSKESYYPDDYWYVFTSVEKPKNSLRCFTSL